MSAGGPAARSEGTTGSPNSPLVVITGSTGRVGSVLARGLSPHYRIRNYNRRHSDELGDQVVGELSDVAKLTEACRGATAVIHLAGNPSRKASWEEAFQTNAVGTKHVLDAARDAGVERFVYGSSCQVTFGYGEHSMQHGDLPPRSLSYYGVSKVAAEQLCHMYSARYGMSAICVRIGLLTASGRLPATRHITGRFLGHDDAVDLFRRAVGAIGVRFAVVYGASNSSRLTFDLDGARRVLGYVPQQCEDDLHEAEPRDPA